MSDRVKTDITDTINSDKKLIQNNEYLNSLKKK